MAEAVELVKLDAGVEEVEAESGCMQKIYEEEGRRRIRERRERHEK